MRQWTKSAISMDTLVTIQVVSETASEVEAFESISQAMQVFTDVERITSRFDPNSEVMQLLQHIGEPVLVSPVLFQQIQFALTVAEMTDGAFDPTVGQALENAGFNRHYLSGEKIHTGIPDVKTVTYRDIVMDESSGTVCLNQPAIIDLGAVAKGFAVDLAARSFADFDGFVVDAGGDVLASGMNPDGANWRIGIRHPKHPKGIWCRLQISDRLSVCTSGTYERRSPVDESQHHIINPATRKSGDELLSCTVVGPFAMMADALSTAAFVMGPEKGIALLEECGVDGMFITSNLEEHMTHGMKRYKSG